MKLDNFSLQLVQESKSSEKPESCKKISSHFLHKKYLLIYDENIMTYKVLYEILVYVYDFKNIHFKIDLSCMVFRNTDSAKYILYNFSDNFKYFR